MGAVARDLRMAVRALTRRPGVTALAILSLGLAIGFCTVGFSLLDAGWLRDMPVREPARLHWMLVHDREQRDDSLTWVEYQALAARGRTWKGVLAECRTGPKVRLPDRDDFPITAGVSENYFDLLGVKAAAGDVFHNGDGSDGIVVIADHYWRTALGGDLHIVGRPLAVGGASLRIIGVLPPAFSGTQRGVLVDLFVPPRTFFGALGFKDHLDPKLADFEATARLRPGVTPEQAKREEDAILRQLQAEGAEPAPGRTAKVAPWNEFKLSTAALLMSPLFLVLLVAAANLANLRLMDNEARRRETGIRLALGAGRGDLLRQHAVETLLLCGTGTALGLVLASWLIALVPALLYAGESYTDFHVGVDARTLAFSVVALVLVALLGTMIPLSDAWKRRVMPSIQAAVGGKPSRWLSALVIAQMAFVMAVTCVSGLLWRSLQNIRAIRPAMDPGRKILLVRGYWNAALPYATRADALVSQLSGLPGVKRIAYARRVLLSGSGGGAAVDLEVPGQPKVSFFYDQVSPGYFATTGARIVNGHGFSSSDGRDTTLVVMVNEAFVRRYASGRNPLGMWVHLDRRNRQIVGVVEDGPTNHLRERLEPYFYFPFAQMPTGEVTIFLEMAGSQEALAAAVRHQTRQKDAAFIVTGMHTMSQHMYAARKEETVMTGASAALAVLGLLLASAGLFGVTSYAVSRRMREFGLRVAFGATRTDLHRQVLKRVALQAAMGIPLGWVMAFAARRLLASTLYGVKPTDPWVAIAACGLVAVVVLCAALRPAFTAARVDPMVALRYE
ncbi:MAG: FtsX-like permease family protein [Bryobacteraceae bacterium]|jgi:predicted permease